METFNKKLSTLLDTANVSPPLRGSSQINVGTNERIASAFGGALLAYLGFKKSGWTGATMMLAGGSLLFKGITGYWPTNDEAKRQLAEEKSMAFEINRSLTIRKPSRAELYAYWRKLENLPAFMKHLKKVEQTSNKESHWNARIPRDLGVISWNAEITEERENELIAWRSLPNSTIDAAGEVRFKDAPAGRGTIVQVIMSYRAPGGSLGGQAAKVLNPIHKQMVKEDLRRFKRLMETGSIPTIEGQPSGRSKSDETSFNQKKEVSYL